MTLHFIRPFWLYALIPAILYLIWVIYSSRQYNPWKNICDPRLLPALLQSGGTTSSNRYLPMALYLLFIIAIFALAGPSWKKANLSVYKNLNSMMLVLDLSPTMQSAEFKPDRLTRAKFKIRDLIHLSQNTQMGLVVFSGEAFVVSPLSQDSNTLSDLLDECDPRILPISGSDIGQGLSLALNLLTQTANLHGDILLITASAPTANSFSVAKAIHQSKNRLQILAMLKQSPTTKFDLAALQQLAQVGGGSCYVFSEDGSDIQIILHNQRAGDVVKDQNVENVNLWQDVGPWFCLLLVPLVLLVLREKA